MSSDFCSFADGVLGDCSEGPVRYVLPAFRSRNAYGGSKFEEIE
jgi:hypothetical protein